MKARRFTAQRLPVFPSNRVAQLTVAGETVALRDFNPPYDRLGSCVTSNAGPNGVRNCTRDEGGPFEFGNQVLISSHRKLLSSKAMVVNVAEKSERDFGRYD
jgi:hypothetical protein